MLDRHPVYHRDKKLFHWILPNYFSTASLLKIINDASRIHVVTVNNRIFVAKAVFN